MEGAEPVGGQLRRVSLVHLSEGRVRVRLVPDQDDRGGFGAADFENALAQRLRVDEGLRGGDGVDQQEALAVQDVQVQHGGELVRPGRVQDFEDAERVVQLDFLPVEVLDGRVVRLSESAGAEAQSDAALAHAASPHHHDLELPHATR